MKIAIKLFLILDMLFIALFAYRYLALRNSTDDLKSIELTLIVVGFMYSMAITAGLCALYLLIRFLRIKKNS